MFRRLGLTVHKLEWAKSGGSKRQLEDAAGILKMQRETLDFRYIQTWVTALELQQQWQASRDLAG